jgi:hypothetical protein
MDIFQVAGIILAVISYIAVYLTFIRFAVQRRRIRREESKVKFLKALLGGLKSGSIVTIDDVVNVYKGVAGLSSEDLSYRFGLSGYLREFLVNVISVRGHPKGAREGHLKIRHLR